MAFHIAPTSLQSLVPDFFRERFKIAYGRSPYTYTAENRLKAVNGCGHVLLAATYDGDGEKIFQLDYVEPEKKNNGNGNGNKKENHEIPVIPEDASDGLSELYEMASGATGSYTLTEYLNDVNRENTEVLAEIGMDGAVKKAYTYGEQRLSVDETGADGSSSSFYLYDARGSVSALSQKGGTLLESYQYDPFGRITFGAPADVNVYGYNAESYNKTTGLLYLRARHYDTETGRFLTEDGYLGTLGNPMSRNRYAYGEGNPLGNVDPSGHSTLTRTIGTAVGMAVSSVGKMAGQVLSTAGAKAKETAKKAQDVAAKYSKSSSSIVRTVANTMRSTANAFQKQAGAYNAMAKTARNMDKVVANVKATLGEVSKRIEASFEEASRTARLIREPVKINGFYFINGENVSRDEFEAFQKRCAEDIARIQFQQNFTKQDTGKEALAAAGLSVLDGAEGLAHLIFQALDGIFHQNGAESLDTLYHNVSDQFRYNTVTYDAVYGLSSLAQLAGGIIGAANAGGAVASNIKNWITGGGTRTLVSGGAVVQGLNLDVALEGVMVEDIAAIFDGLGILNSTASESTGGDEKKAGTKKNKIPDNDSTTGHIFRDAEGHIPDTPENRTLLEDVANDPANYRGVDKYGNEWYTKIQSDGSQVWVESRNGNIFEGGINNVPKIWNSETGLKRP